MKRSRRYALSAVFALQMFGFTVFAAPLEYKAVSDGAGDSSLSTPPPEQRNTTVEHLWGQKAADYLAQSRLRYLAPGAHLRRAGAEPTQNVVVLRWDRARPAAFEGRLSQGSYALATVASTSQGSVTFWSWDDGNDATWEGVVTVENYSNGAWSTWEAQIDISTSAYTTLWAERTGGEIEEEYQTRNWSEPNDLRLAQWGPRGGCAGCAYATQEYQDFIDCIVTGCSGVAAACRMMGPGWANCFAAGCAGVAVDCALDTLR